MSLQYVGRIFGLSILLVSFGCGRSDLPDLGTVTGKVTLNGEPLKDAIVNFTPKGEGRPSTGETNEQGEYELVYLADVDGAIVGDHNVTIELIQSVEMDDLPEDPREWPEGFTPPPQLPDNAMDRSMSKTVESGSNEINIDLTNG